MASISAVLIVKNEAARLARCLEALRSVADEIVVVDTGSTDATEAVARAFTSRVYCFAWRDDFAAARNAALAHATGDWVLSIDADEVVDAPEDARTLLLSFAAANDPTAVGTIEVLSPTGPEDDAPASRDHLERFFRRGAYRFAGAIHEQLVPTGGGAKRAASTGVRAYHHGYAQSQDAPDHKALRNLPLLLRELEAQPEDEYLIHQLGKAYYTLGRYAEAAHAFERALDAVRFTPGGAPEGRFGPVSRAVTTDLVVTLAYAYVNVGQTTRALRLLETHAAIDHPGTRRADFAHVLGYVHLMLGHVAEAKAAYDKSLEYGAACEDVLGTGTFSSEYHLGLLSEAEGDLAAAWEHYQTSLRHKPDYRPTLARCIDLAAERHAPLPHAIIAAADPTALERVRAEKARRR
ncbi:MAG TPA: glycosyltransferase [Candidatus Hydrogenedentes bacterium]|nr:glycosyltransferase [Candidatus Hydrogenedentota bacterium]